MSSVAPPGLGRPGAARPCFVSGIAAEVARWTERQRISVGLLTLYIPHTSAPLLIQENASPDVRRDLDAFLPRIGARECRAIPPQ